MLTTTNPMQLADQLEIAAAAHRFHVARERCRIHRAIVSPSGRATDGHGYDLGAALALTEDVVNGREDSAASIALAQLFRLVSQGASDRAIADVARQFVEHTIDDAVRINVEMIEADEGPAKRYGIEGEDRHD